MSSKLLFMKKLLIVFTIFSSIYSTNSFAQDKTPAIVSEAFQTSFTNTKEVTWTEVNDLYKAAFTSDGQSLYAFFNADGSLVASAREVSLLQLPLSLQNDFRKNYHDYTATNLFEVDNDGGSTYYVTVEGNSAKLQLKSTSYGTWDAYKKSRI